MKQSEQIAARSSVRYFRVPGMACRFAMLAALAASMGCSSDPDDELPLKPCGVEERFIGDTGGRRSYTHRAYDERGNHVLSERDNDGDGTVDDRFIWQYAPGGGLTLAGWSFNNGSMEDEVAAQYDDDDRLIFVTWTSSRDTAGRVDYEYDGEQRIIEHWDRDNDGAVEEIVTYTYDADGKLQESAVGCAGSVVPRWTTTPQWGEGGRIERIENRRDGELSSFTQFTYNQDGLLEHWERSVNGEVVISETYAFDSEGNVREVIFESIFAFGEVPRRWRSTHLVYDADGRVLSSKTTNEGTITSERTYLYECPDYEDSPGRYVGEPASPLLSPPTGPRGGVGSDAITAYARSAGYSCP